MSKCRSRGMPWWRVDTGTAQHEKIFRLCDALQEDLADAYLFRLWDWFADNRPSGRIPVQGAAGIIARAVRFKGVAENLLKALLSSGLLDECGEEYEVHDWPEHQEALAAKAKRDREAAQARRDARKRTSFPPAQEVARPSHDSSATVAGESRVSRAILSPLSTLSSQVDEGAGEDPAPPSAAGQVIALQLEPPPNHQEGGKVRRRASPPGQGPDPRHAPLVRALADRYRELAGVPYGFRGGRDARAVSECLALADQNTETAGDAAPEEIVRRWSIGLLWRWGNGECPVQDLGALARHWNACVSEVTAPPARRRQRDALSGVVLP
jgi:hypothetical protein